MCGGAGGSMICVWFELMGPEVSTQFGPKLSPDHYSSSYCFPWLMALLLVEYLCFNSGVVVEYAWAWASPSLS